MIEALQIRDPETTVIPWWTKVDALKDVDEFTFQPKGLTILWGPNGSGKSTLLKALARLTHCEKAGIPKITRSSMDHFYDGYGSDKILKHGFHLVHDGKPVHFYDPTSEPGLTSGQFDDDFFSDAMATMRLRQVSSGQRTAAGQIRIIESAKTLEKVGCAFSLKQANEQWKWSYENASYALKATVKNRNGKRTVLLDEPGRSLDIPRQAGMWDGLARQNKFQLIIATHSVFALNIESAKFIDLEEGYLAECRKAVESIDR